MPNVFQIGGSMDIVEANNEMDLDLPEGEYETIAGFVLDQIGEIPNLNDEFEYKDLTFRVLEMDRFKIESLLITRDSNTENTSVHSESNNINDENFTN